MFNVNINTTLYVELSSTIFMAQVILLLLALLLDGLLIIYMTMWALHLASGSMQYSVLALRVRNALFGICI